MSQGIIKLCHKVLLCLYIVGSNIILTTMYQSVSENYVENNRCICENNRGMLSELRNRIIRGKKRIISSSLITSVSDLTSNLLRDKPAYKPPFVMNMITYLEPIQTTM